MVCRICKSDRLDPPVTLREMMFGTRAEFEYVRCSDCDTLQIVDIPVDMAAHYPEGSYYSFAHKRRTWREFIKSKLKPTRRPEWAASLNSRASVLDIGCGRGGLLVQMSEWGFTNLRGYDPFVPNDFDKPVPITKSRPSGKFDVVMMHHALEHVPDPLMTFSEIETLLAECGKVIIRIPVRQGFAWRTFALNWAHLDPPRHFYIWTVDGFEAMVRSSGFTVVEKGFDGTLFSIIGSELYEKDIPLQSEGQSNLRLTVERTSELNALVAQHNETGDGDSAWFILERL